MTLKFHLMFLYFEIQIQIVQMTMNQEITRIKVVDLEEIDYIFFKSVPIS